ncbi:hypothetical protein [Hydrogenophaga sp.]|uniref:sensor histidine kinase n=1 Tax=Hydrogenophaga sp. TaxID=1904254 RepID=UPI0026179FDC|nr:hypothetical protein [Hydrogenophaga sp.]MCW5654393.1 hypothetical protein [Hydrogenophaga sp.]
MPFPSSPRTLQAFGVLLVLACLLTSLALALQAPVTGLRLTVADGGAVVVHGEVPPRVDLAPGQRLVSLAGVDLRADLLIEEPDQLPDWGRYGAFMADMTRLARAMPPGGEVVAVLDDGRKVSLPVQTRSWLALPALFWFQAGVGVLCFLLAYGVWVFRWHDAAARHFAVCGLSVMVSACSAAVYSTRELALDGDWFRALSVANHGGAMLFTAALLALLWHYPTRLARRSPAAPIYLVAGLATLAFGCKTFDAPSTGFLVLLAMFALTFAVAAVQWRRTRGRPLERAALQWYLLSIYLGTGFFAAGILLPVALRAQPLASQGLMFGVFLFMFAGIALGILRYRLFDLDRWWFGAWSWFLGGLCVLLLDLALVSLFDMSQAGALSLSLALLGWVYFPVRQWLWARLAERRAWQDPDSLGRSLEHLAAAPDAGQLAQRWHQVLREEFAPLELRVPDARASDGRTVTIEENGLALRLPGIDGPGAGEGGVLLRMPQSGARLFRRADVARADVLWRMARHVQEAMLRREQDVQAERRRIMRDLHDDLGAKLLSLSYLGQEEARQIARSAMQDMRDVLAALSASPCGLDEALQAWQAQTRERLAPLSRSLDWRQDPVPQGLCLSARQYTNLGRILREAVTNSLKHADAQTVRVVWRLASGRLLLSVEDEGAKDTTATPTQARSISERVRDLGGTVTWSSGSAGGTVVEVEVPLHPTS